MPIKTTHDRVTPDLKRKQAELGRLPQQMALYWRSITPQASGRARRSTRLVGDEIRADYPYAVPLDRGSSRQAPRGMSQPTLAEMRKTLERIMR